MPFEVKEMREHFVAMRVDSPNSSDPDQSNIERFCHGIFVFHGSGKGKDFC